jgi:hypothetical protein
MTQTVDAEGLAKKVIVRARVVGSVLLIGRVILAIVLANGAALALVD